MDEPGRAATVRVALLFAGVIGLGLLLAAGAAVVVFGV